MFQLSMMNIFTKKELKENFQSPLSYVLTSLFSLACGLCFLNVLFQYFSLQEAHAGEYVDPIFYVVIGFFTNVNIVLIFLIPLICMNLFSKEYRNAVFDLIRTSKLKAWNIISGKFIASMVLFTFMLSTLGIFFIIFWYSGIYEYSFVITGVLSLILNSLLYISLGVFLSSLITSPIICAFTHIICLVAMNMFHNLLSVSSNFGIYEIINYLSLTSHFINILRGVVYSSDLIYYGSFSFLFLFFAKKVLEWRKV
ncbi:MAG: hypothetical protein H6621_08660 [Halobacteriovoraceae bacterium]|nr:hypothetical protein [Halobacteriovoraceae bacterium]MCB9095124.1 hypothetical protein [Halobacteriovoraceae bacterium]